ncbi:hypothetical protein AB0K05_35830 [Nonomuraea sp. NPDC049486]|uniref:Uncharacterized protein n=1 Tax=Nonomuraea harbinensis TaxID=1286938 RepID=A0ABW1BR81_9ACTN|nr:MULTISPECIES: hypothetical protein [Nonomuraea]TXK41313.1 hypothetical protein FR742_18610 [Nonomuraea sp. C10]
MNVHLFQTSRPHLAPGMILDAPLDYDDFILGFGDETEARAELFFIGGRPLLVVGGYMTMDGTVVDERMWTVSEVTVSGDRRILRLGHPLE